MNIELVAAWATSLSLPIGLAALIYAAVQTKLSRRATAASVVIAASDSFRTAWQGFDAASDDESQRHAFSEVLNFMEVCCAIHRDGLLVGRSGASLEAYLVNVLVQIDQSPAAVKLFGEFVETDRTFEEIGHFLIARRAQRADFASRLRMHSGRRQPQP